MMLVNNDVGALLRPNYSYFLSDLDAAGKPPSGVLRGNLYWSLSAEQCDAIPNSHYCGSVFTIYTPGLPVLE